jgi:hypothetical protein
LTTAAIDWGDYLPLKRPCHERPGGTGSFTQMENLMMKSLLMATAGLALMVGGASAQLSSSSTSTTETTTAVPVVPAPSSVTETTRHVTTDRHGGVDTEESGTTTTTGPAVPMGGVTATKKTETTTVR